MGLSAKLPSGYKMYGRLFRGVSPDYIAAGTPYALLDNSTRMTVIIWLKTGADVATIQALLTRFSDAAAPAHSDNQFFCNIQGARQTFRMIDRSATGSIVLLPNTRYKLSWVYDGNLATDALRLKMFVAKYIAYGSFQPDVQDGAVAYVGAVPTLMSAPLDYVELRMGLTDNFFNRWPFAGVINEVRLWRGVALSATQVAQEMLNTNPVTPSLRYRFNDPTNTRNFGLWNMGSDGVPGVTNAYNTYVAGPIVPTILLG